MMKNNPYAALAVVLLVVTVVFMLFVTGAVAKLANREAITTNGALSFYGAYYATEEDGRYALIEEYAASRRPPITFAKSLAGVDCTQPYFRAQEELDAVGKIISWYREPGSPADISRLPEDARNEVFETIHRGIMFVDVWDECVHAE